jgi:hypothetical protein
MLSLLASTGQRLWAGQSHWYEARRDSAQIAPDPAQTPEAVVQVYAARAYGWRGIFGVHTWMAVKPAGYDHYRRLEVIGWGAGNGRSVVRVHRNSPPDGFWFGNHPELLADIRGPAASAAIPQIKQAAENYPFWNRYTVWPGPNSNTFIAHIGRHVPALGLDLPPTAIGKDYTGTDWLSPAPSGQGVQLSAFGLAGILLAIEEGFEVNLLGVSVGIDVNPPALRLPGLGRLGFTQNTRHE